MTTNYVKTGAESFNNQDAQLITWNLADGETGDAFALPAYADRSVQVFGDFGGGSVVFEGSNEGDTATAAHFKTLSDPQGNALSFSTDGLKAVSEMTRLVRPKVVTGTAVSLTIILFAKR